MGGAKNCPETPRQKMIGMMYLVLTAMLALNVSTNVLNAFGLVDKSLHISLDNAMEQNEQTYTRLENMYKDNPEKVGQFWARADSMRTASDSLYNYIQHFKEQVHYLVDGPDVAPEDLTVNIQGVSDFDNPGTYALVKTDPISGKHNGQELRERIATYRNQLIRIRHADANSPRRPGQSDEAYERMQRRLASIREEINTVFATDSAADNSGDMQPWEHAIFEGMPVGACMAILTKYQNDIRAYEGKTLTTFLGRIGGQDYKANSIQAYVIPKSSYVLRGGQYEAQIILAAVDTTDKPQYFVGDMQLGEDGIFRAPATSVGEHPFSGIIRYKKGNRTEQAEFASSFIVGEPSASVMNEDLNIIYRDFDNRYVISAPGVTDNQLTVNVQGATAKREGRIWILRPQNDAKQVKVTVHADMNGNKVMMGEKSFKVQRLPMPSPYFMDGGKQVDANKVSRKNLNKNTVLEIGYGEDGLLEVPFEIVSFDTYILRKTGKSSGNKFSAAQLKQIGNLKSGDLILVQNIKYRTKGGSEQMYNSNLTLMLK